MQLLLAALRNGLPPLLALATAWGFDRMCRRRGLQPPGFVPRGPGDEPRAWARRTTAGALLAIVLWLGVFSPLGQIGLPQATDLSGLSIPQLFLLHVLFGTAIAAWYLLGFAGTRPGPTGAWTAQLGLRTPSLAREALLGVGAGIVAWAVVIAAVVGIGLGLWALGEQHLLPQQPPALVAWIAALPFAVRFGVSLSAGVFEEAFFRGFLQPRLGIWLSSLLFVFAHLTYGQPFLLVGVAMLSLLYALLVEWRQNIWPAIIAHAIFDGVQLLVVIPSVLDMMKQGHRIATTFVAGLIG